MKLVSFSVEGLFGRFDHDIPVATGDPVQIIFGRNGVGKTTVLRLMHGLFSKNFSLLRGIDFARIVAVFDDGSTLSVHRWGGHQPGLFDDADVDAPLEEELAPSEETGEVEIILEYASSSEADPERVVLPPLDANAFDAPLGFIERRIDHLERVAPTQWLDVVSGDILSLEQVISEYSTVLPEAFARHLGLGIPEDSVIHGVLDAVTIELIETQRLRRGSRPSGRVLRGRPGVAESKSTTVEQYAEDLANLIRQNRAKYLRVSQLLDREFPKKLLGSERALSEKDIRARFNSLVEKNARLARLAVQEAGLIPLPSDRELSEYDRRVLGIYLDDAEQKFDVFEDYLTIAELFKSIIDELFVGKTLEFDQRRGFFFRTPAGERLSPSSLSSGEQHEVILAYDLLFRFSAGSIILIDEPEISLHVAWQRLFIENVLRISTVRDFDFVIATHSPQIVERHVELMVELAG